MQTFDRHLIALYRDGMIEPEDALSVASNPHDLQVALRRPRVWSPDPEGPLRRLERARGTMAG
jgi:Tfp pilus assembly ATPase PilU